MIKFPKIGQFRNAVANVKHRATSIGTDENGDIIFDENAPLPKLKYRGTIKLHGTNAGLRIEEDRVVPQSRSTDLRVGADNAGFALFVEGQTEAFWRALAGPYRVLYGEWCGSGIQSGTAVQQLDKMFVVFAACMEPDEDGIAEWAPPEFIKNIWDPERRIFNVERASDFEIEVDFADPKASLPQLEALTQKVEDECPFGASFGSKGIGEGIVWVPVDPKWNQEGESFWFKTKGLKHTERKAKTKITVSPEVMESINEFVSETVVPNRLEKGLDHLRSLGVDPITRKSTGIFIKWIAEDIQAEESDVLEASDFEWADVGKQVQSTARQWLFDYIDVENNLC